MRILILSPMLPYPLTQGGRIRIFNIVKNLSENHKVIFVCLSDKRSGNTHNIKDSPLWEYCEEVVAVERKQTTAWDLLKFFLGSDPFNSIRYSSADLRDRLIHIVKHMNLDLVQVEFSFMWQYADVFKGLPVVLDAHNVEWDIIRQISEMRASYIAKALYRVEQGRLERLEREAWRESDYCFSVSDRERDIIASSGATNKVKVIPNGVDTDMFGFAPKTKTGNRLLFLGGMEYAPNLDAARYLFIDIYDLIKAKVPEVQIDIVGREIWRVGEILPADGVAVHENVAEVMPYFRNADVLVVPLRHGSGTRIKIVEAMSAGLAVVSTSKGCEGIDVINGKHLMVADSPSEFAEAVKELLENDNLRGRLCKNARMLAEEKYSWKSLVSKMEDAYKDILRNRRVS